MAEPALVQKACIPCRGVVPPMPTAEVARLLAQVPGWGACDDDTKIEARFRFADFCAALDFVREVGELAEAEFHHPAAISFGWSFAAVVLQTKKIKGLHENDFILAAKINEIARGSQPPPRLDVSPARPSATVRERPGYRPANRALPTVNRAACGVTVTSLPQVSTVGDSALVFQRT